MNLWSLLFPQKCVFCGKVLKSGAEYACAECLETVAIPSGARCQKCGKPLPGEHALPVCLACRTDKYGFTSVYAPFLYQGAVKRGLYRLKFHGKRSSARVFADFIHTEMTRKGIPPVEIVTAIPIDLARTRDRGYNQSELIARHLAKRLGVPCRPLLRRHPGVPRQVGLSGKERRTNMKNAFRAADETRIRNAVILVVDDVFTTGATVGEAARTLLSCGAAEVYAATVAVTPSNR